MVSRIGRRISLGRDVLTGDDHQRTRRCKDARVTEQTLARARAGDEDTFRNLTDPYRRELQLHMYRIVGSAQDAEDLVQETLLAAWPGLERFEGRSSVRAWLYRIATNHSLDALRASRRRPEGQRMTEMPEPTRYGEPVWLEPYADVLLEGIPDDAPGPEAQRTLSRDPPRGGEVENSSIGLLLSWSSRARTRPCNASSNTRFGSWATAALSTETRPGYRSADNSCWARACSASPPLTLLPGGRPASVRA